MDYTVTYDGRVYPALPICEKDAKCSSIGTDDSDNVTYDALKWHREMNIVDTKKDGKVTTGTLESDLFINALNSLYGAGANAVPFQKLKVLEHFILDNPLIYGHQIKICGLSKKAMDMNIDQYKGPDSFNTQIPTRKWAINDAAMTPTDFCPGILEIETPGSYIDPGGRSKGNQIWPPVGNEITIDLSSFGFAGIGFTAKFIEERDDTDAHLCEITIKKGQNVILDVKINRKGHILKKKRGSAYDEYIGKQYFEGNQEKNKFLIEESINFTLPNQKEAELFLLCKELGDKLQTIFTHIMRKIEKDNYDSGENTIAGFTGDIPFACNMILLGNDVLLRRTVDNKKVGPNAGVQEEFEALLRHYNFYMSKPVDPKDAAKQINTCKIDSIIKSNELVRLNVNIFIGQNDPASLFPVTFNISKITSIWNYTVIPLLREKIIDSINNVNQILINLKNNNDTMQSGVLELEQYRAVDVVNIVKEGGNKKYRLNGILQSLYNDNIDDVEDPIKVAIRGSKNLGQYIISVVPPRRAPVRLSGGQKKINQKGGELTVEKLSNIFVSNFFSIFFNYFSYIGETYFDTDFLISIMMMEQLPTLAEFKGLYDRDYQKHTNPEVNPENYHDNDDIDLKVEGKKIEDINKLFIDKLTEISQMVIRENYFSEIITPSLTEFQRNYSQYVIKYMSEPEPVQSFLPLTHENLLSLAPPSRFVLNRRGSTATTASVEEQMRMREARNIFFDILSNPEETKSFKSAAKARSRSRSRSIKKKETETDREKRERMERNIKRLKKPETGSVFARLGPNENQFIFESPRNDVVGQLNSSSRVRSDEPQDKRQRIRGGGLSRRKHKKTNKKTRKHKIQRNHKKTHKKTIKRNKKNRTTRKYKK